MFFFPPSLLHFLGAKSYATFLGVFREKTHPSVGRWSHWGEQETRKDGVNGPRPVSSSSGRLGGWVGLGFRGEGFSLDLGGGGESNFHPRKFWGRWRHFEEQIFWDGVGSTTNELCYISERLQGSIWLMFFFHSKILFVWSNFFDSCSSMFGEEFSQFEFLRRKKMCLNRNIRVAMMG